MDYRILGMMHDRVPGMWIVVELQQRLVETWTEFQRNIVFEANEQWRNKLCSCAPQREVTNWNTFYKK